MELALLVEGITTDFADLVPFVYRFGPPVLCAALGIFAFLYLGPKPPETQAFMETTNETP